MKLIIKREQQAQTGMFGGHKGMKFLLSYRVELTPEEQELVDKYKAGNHPLTFRTDQKGNKIPKHTISSLMSGHTELLEDVTILLNNEDVIKDACKDFKMLLEIMTSFGGEEVFEF